MSGITFKGQPVTLVGKRLQPGDSLPEFTLCDNSLEQVEQREIEGASIFLTVPSLDTGVCDLEVKRFNQKTAELPGISIYVVSLDLPFAQKRWCGANGIEAVRTLSDYKERSFGRATGTLIEELALLTRAVFVTDGQKKVVYAQYVPEISDHPDYEAAYRAARDCTE